MNLHSKRLFHKLSLLLPILVIFIIPVFAFTDESERCGQLMPDVPSLTFSQLTVSSDSASMYEQINITTKRERLTIPLSIPEHEIVSEWLILSDQTMVFLTYPTLATENTHAGEIMGIKSLYILLPSGEWLNPTFDGLFWRHLLTERSSGHFGMLGYDQDNRVFILEAIRTDQGINWQTPRILSLSHDIFSTGPFVPMASPTWRYLYDLETTAQGATEAVIYDTESDQILWRSVETRPTGFEWVENDQWIALVTLSNGQVTGIDRTGNALSLIELTYQDDRLSWFTGVRIGETQLAFWITKPVFQPTLPAPQGELVIYDFGSRQLTSLCYQGVIGPLHLSEDQSHLLFSSPRLEQPFSLTLISVQNGDYTYFPSDQAVILPSASFELR